MPLYDYECRECVYYTEILQGMMDDPIRECPNCGKNALVKVIINPPAAIVRGEANTIGQLADQNTRKMGKYELQDRQQKGFMSRFMGIGAPLAAGAGRRFVNAGIFDYDLPAFDTVDGKGGPDGITSLTMRRDRSAVLAIMKYISRIWHYKRSQYGE